MKQNEREVKRKGWRFRPWVDDHSRMRRRRSEQVIELLSIKIKHRAANRTGCKEV